jgi:VWFA-related protein
VSLVSVTAVVRDRRGRVVRDLERDDFLVLDAGRPARIVEFRPAANGPVSVALLVDVSGSMQVASKLADARGVAHHILSTLEPAAGDEAAVYAFDSRLRAVQPFTEDLSRLREALDRIEPYGSTSLYDAVAETARQIVTGDSRRRAVIVLTDGVDTSSRRTAVEVSSIASAIDVPVFVVAAVSPLDHQQMEAEGDGLDSLARWTGGALFVTSTAAHASVAARAILADLRHQYLIAFESSGQPGWHSLEVRTRDPNLRVRARGGYTTG